MVQQTVDHKIMIFEKDEDVSIGYSSETKILQIEIGEVKKEYDLNTTTFEEIIEKDGSKMSTKALATLQILRRTLDRPANTEVRQYINPVWVRISPTKVFVYDLTPAGIGTLLFVLASVIIVLYNVDVLIDLLSMFYNSLPTTAGRRI